MGTAHAEAFQTPVCDSPPPPALRCVLQGSMNLYGGPREMYDICWMNKWTNKYRTKSYQSKSYLSRLNSTPFFLIKPSLDKALPVILCTSSPIFSTTPYQVCTSLDLSQPPDHEMQRVPLARRCVPSHPPPLRICHWARLTKLGLRKRLLTWVWFPSLLKLPRLFDNWDEILKYFILKHRR